MAIRRMLSKKIIDTDAFIDMPLSSQALYMHLVVNADDEGFVGNVNRIMRTINCSSDDKRILEAKRFILGFESGVIVIKHWYIHNLIRNDRFNPTTYLDEKNQLIQKENKSYTYLNNTEKEIVIPKDTPISIDKVNKNSLIKEIPFVEKVDKKSNKKQKEKIPYQEILHYLNLKVKKKKPYKDSETNKKYIKVRWEKDKMRLQDYYDTIDNAFAFRMAQDGDLSQMKPSVIFNGEMEARASGDHYAWFYNKQQPKKEEPKGTKRYDGVEINFNKEK